MNKNTSKTHNDNQLFWLKCWQENQIGFHQSDITPYLRHHSFSTDATVLLPLCGKTLDLLWLATKVKKVVGVEIVPQAIEEFSVENHIKFSKDSSKYFEHYRNKNIEILSGDFLQLTPEIAGKFSIIFDRAALVALPLEIRNKYAKTVISLMKDTMLLVTLDYPQNEKQGPPFAISDTEVHRLYGRDCDIRLLDKKPSNEGSFKNLSYGYESFYSLKLKQ